MARPTDPPANTHPRANANPARKPHPSPSSRPTQPDMAPASGMPTASSPRATIRKSWNSPATRKARQALGPALAMPSLEQEEDAVADDRPDAQGPQAPEADLAVEGRRGGGCHSVRPYRVGVSVGPVPRSASRSISPRS